MAKKGRKKGSKVHGQYMGYMRHATAKVKSAAKKIQKKSGFMKAVAFLKKHSK